VHPTRLLFFVFMFHLMDERLLSAQTFLTSFGRMLDIKVPQGVHGLVAGDFNGDGRTDLAVADGSRITIKYQEKTPMAWRSSNLFVGKPIKTLSVARMNRDRFADIVVVTESPFTVESYLARPAEKFTFAWKKDAPESADKMIAADITNDGKADLLFFGKKQLGLFVWTGKGDGAFRESITLFPEYSLSEVSIGDFNGDGVADVLASNWISNQILVFTGFGKMSFSDPAIIPCDAEPSFLTQTLLNADGNTDIVAGFVEENTYSTFLGNGLGGYRLSQTFQCDSDLLNLAAADVNGDGKDDVIALTGQGLNVKQNDGEGGLGEAAYFAGGRLTTEFVVFRNAPGMPVSAAALDSVGAHLRVLYNTRISLPSEGDESYGIGFTPRGIITADVNHDGWMDILTANGSSKSFSLFLGYGKGRFEGQISFQTVATVERVRCIPKDDSTMTLIGFSQTAESISIVDVNIHTFSHVITTLPTQGSVDLLSERRDSSTGFLHLFALEYDASNHLATPIEYEQITPTRFIERSYSSLTRFAPIAGVLCDLNSDGVRDLAFLSWIGGKHRMELLLARGKDAEEFYAPESMFTLDSPVQTAALLWSHDVTNDGLPDLLINLLQPENVLLVSPGRKDAKFAPPSAAGISAITIQSRDDLQFINLQSDGKADIVLDNSLSRLIQIYTGKGNGEFIQSMRLISTERAGGFTLSEIHHAGSPALIYTDSGIGSLRIIDLERAR